MTQNTTKPLVSANSRVFLIEGRARFDHKPSYECNIRLTGITQGYGDLTPIEVPNPDQYGKFDQVGEIRGANARATSSLQGRYVIDLRSTLMRLAADGCAIDVQLHFGECKNPATFTSFDKAIVLEDVFISQYATDDLGALASGDNAAVNETADISGETLYEILPVSYGVKAGSIVINEVTGVTTCDSPSCGDCGTQSNGCKKVIGVTTGASGSPPSIADVVFTTDGGTTWFDYDMGTCTAASDVACVSGYCVVVSNADIALYYTLTTTLDGVTAPTFTKITTGLVRGPNAIWSVGSLAFIVGSFGYIYKTEDPTVGVTVLDAGTLTISNLNDVHAISKENAVAVGDNGAVVYTNDGVSWSSTATNPCGIGTHLNAVYMKSATEWIVGTSGGKLYYTINSGTTWTEKTFPGSGTGAVKDIQGSSDSVIWLAHQTAATKGRILRSYDGGYQWIVTPEGTGSIPVADKYGRLAVCSYDVNFVCGVGLADDAADGIIVIGGAA